MTTVMEQEPGVFPEGRFTAWAEPGGMRAEIREGSRVVKRFNSETAWSDAVRIAGDMNQEDRG